MARLSSEKLTGRGTCPYLGRAYPLRVDPSRRFPLTWSPEEGFIISVGRPREVRLLMKQWYTHRAHETLGGRVAHFAPTMNLFPKKVRIRDTRSRWGSCSHRDVINFSWRMMALPSGVIDYIVVHELAHIREKNHGPAFWRLVASFVPDHKTHRAWLRLHTRSFLL
ncbi:MAG: M48 family metallopeptidase [Deltaproteobacteria bacterium]